MTASNAVFAVSDHTQLAPRLALLWCGPAVPEAGVVFDEVEIGIAIAELLADTLDEGSYIGTIALRAVSGDKVLAVDKIINLAVADVLPRLIDQQRDDPEFRQGEVDCLAGPQRPVNVEAQLEPTDATRNCPPRICIGRGSS